ncbi:hypothetical protein LIER_07238 [Lithospermum erythrorhizon]|uniref:Kinesin motor domain-containing protein n=1 Tax=Lithospermum erythrorhizon TaxID=34254 RepID=A0AAV3PBP9_LITER
MRSIYGDDSNPLDVHGSTPHEEKILVSVRLRPLNEREVSQNDVSDWECVNNTTIISKGHDRPMSPTTYSFDRVFGSDSSTRQVYEEGAKKVALSVVNGINASIFAYGQTSSGKTYTMSGVTEYTLSDIYDYITKHESREFVLKFAAMEIYNECVRDLLTSENTTLRLLDDPERGTVVEKLTEVTLRDWEHLRELLSACTAQRQTGETSLNEMSSRSHQILRLTVESSTRKYSTSHNSDILAATVNFVDLAGSERASQTMSANTRLKEGCHINRSLLTLGTVIRKLSKGRNVHVPYRDSKLTRILQNSLGGNARTAIICTLSPAHTHFEQSRNTLVFASCAKQVTTSAQVNVVMSEKALVRLLKKELARLEKQLKQMGSLSSGSCESLSALQAKERLIEKMDKEIRELIQQRDHAHSRLQDLQHSRSLSWAELSNFSDSPHEKGSVWQDNYSASEVSEIVDPLRSENASSNASQRLSDRYEGITDSNNNEEFEGEEQLLSADLSPTKFIDKYFGPDPSLGWEKMSHTSDQNIQEICQEVQCVEVEVDKSSLKYEQVPSPQSSCHQESKADNDNETSKIDALDKENNTSVCVDDTSHPIEDMNYSSEIDMSSVSRGNVDISRERRCEAIIIIMSSSDVTKDRENVIQSGPEEETQEEVEAADNLKEFELNHDNEKLNDSKDKTEISNEENIDQQDDCSTPFKKDYDLKCKKQFEDNSKDSISSSEVEKLECSQNNENVVENLECQKQNVDNHYVSSTEYENLECDKQTVDNHAREDKNSECHKQIVDNQVSEVENNEPQKMIVDDHLSVVSSPEDENLKSENHCGDNPTCDVVSSIDNDNIQSEEKQSEDNQVLAIEPTSDKLQNLPGNESLVVHDSQLSSSSWSLDFEKQRQEIIELWNACNVPLVHRTYFFLLFKGEPADSIYMEVERRRLCYLRATLCRSAEAFHVKALQREREKLRRQILKKFSAKEMESIYEKWEIDLKSKQRRLQLCRRLWTNTKDMEHIKESAALVAKLVGLVEPSHAPKEIFGLSLPTSTVRSHSWHGLPVLP